MHETQVKILKHINRKPDSTYADIAKAIQMPLTGTVVHHIRQLVTGGFLKRNSRWSLTKTAKLVLREGE
jgi:predicted transcriptional regulator